MICVIQCSITIYYPNISVITSVCPRVSIPISIRSFWFFYTLPFMVNIVQQTNLYAKQVTGDIKYESRTEITVKISTLSITIQSYLKTNRSWLFGYIASLLLMRMSSLKWYMPMKPINPLPTNTPYGANIYFSQTTNAPYGADRVCSPFFPFFSSFHFYLFSKPFVSI